MPDRISQKLTVNHVQTASNNLADSFEDDPCYSWLIPDPTTRIEGLREYFFDKTLREIRNGADLSYISSTGTSVYEIIQIPRMMKLFGTSPEED